MGIFAFKLPDIGEGVVEGEVVEWMVSVGDTVKEDDPILSVMTDKATVEIPSPTDGVVKSIVGEPGTILAVGQVCIEFETDGEGTPVEESPEPVEEVVEEAKPEPTPEPETAPEPAPASASTSTCANSSSCCSTRGKTTSITGCTPASTGEWNRFDHCCRKWTCWKNHSW